MPTLTPPHAPNQPTGSASSGLTITVTEAFAAPAPGVPTRTEAVAGAIRTLLTLPRTESAETHPCSQSDLAANAADPAPESAHTSRVAA